MDVRPSTVIARIDAYWEFPRQEQERPSQDSPKLDSSHSDKVRVIYKLCQQLDPTLLPTGNDRARYEQAVEAMNDALERWIHASDRRHVQLSSVKHNGRWMNVITVVRAVLSRCPDEPALMVAGDLAFIKDADTRNDLARDIDDTRWAVENHRWKVATVLAGAAIEALLLWGLNSTPEPQRDAAVASVTAKKGWRSPSSRSLDEWGLFQYIPVAEELGLIERGTAAQAMQAKDFRNLIHPGLVKRKERRCNEATALGARAGVLLVIEDLKKKFPI